MDAVPFNINFLVMSIGFMIKLQTYLRYCNQSDPRVVYVNSKIGAKSKRIDFDEDLEDRLPLESLHLPTKLI